MAPRQWQTDAQTIKLKKEQIRLGNGDMVVHDNYISGYRFATVCIRMKAPARYPLNMNK